MIPFNRRVMILSVVVVLLILAGYTFWVSSIKINRAEPIKNPPSFSEDSRGETLPARTASPGREASAAPLLLPGDNRFVSPEYRGDGTARDSVSSYLWGLKNKEFNVMGRQMVFGSKASPVMEIMYDRLPPEIRERVDSPTAMWAAFLAANPLRQSPQEYAVIEERANDEGRTDFVLNVRYIDNTVREQRLEFVRQPDGRWLNLVHDRYIAPAYAQPKYTANQIAKSLGLPTTDDINDLDTMRELQRRGGIPNSIDEIVPEDGRPSTGAR